jgi:hypothetical protein
MEYRKKLWSIVRNYRLSHEVDFHPALNFNLLKLQEFRLRLGTDERDLLKNQLKLCN